MASHRTMSVGRTVLVVLSAIISACASKSSGDSGPTSPTVVADSITHSLPLSGETTPFSWTLDLSPARNTQLTIGQSFSLTFRCNAPNGFTFYMNRGITTAPGPNWTTSLTRGWQNTASACSPSNFSGVTSQTSSSTPDMPYYRWEVWVERGSFTLTSTPPVRPPDIVIDDVLGWRKP
jgi:hypothetical protein